MADAYLEVELRYKVHDVPACLQQLAKLGLTVTKTERLIDEWYAPLKVTSLETQRTWFDQERGVAWRIRRHGVDGAMQLEVTSKQLSEHDNHNSFIETLDDLASYPLAVAAMKDKGYRNWLTLDKTRYYLSGSAAGFDPNEFEFVLDDIDGLAAKVSVGACLEIEYKGTDSRDVALQKLHAAGAKLGFGEDDLFEKSLTVVAMTVLARF